MVDFGGNGLGLGKVMGMFCMGHRQQQAAQQGGESDEGFGKHILKRCWNEKVSRVDNTRSAGNLLRPLCIIFRKCGESVA
ncbi:hypothetical protein MAY91_08195 [Edwardsiella ictaluri]|uniref:Uncharacterized protein n=1 Tax=Edwardsiella ictaluri TaxID=67780 RepID=A0ABY8GLT5_EDWIC|nr:hypothetical protein [Edwardsiella ictaluri]WFN98238.1 hypothetical protein MAY91_08195 [Edwardsiella ictaluri]